jgi:hypothetical protein
MDGVILIMATVGVILIMVMEEATIMVAVAITATQGQAHTMQAAEAIIMAAAGTLTGMLMPIAEIAAEAIPMLIAEMPCITAETIQLSQETAGLMQMYQAGLTATAET